MLFTASFSHNVNNALRRGSHVGETMTVRSILDSKGNHVASIDPDVKMATAVKTLAERRIGALLVMGDGQIDGILSERDVVRVLAERGPGVLDESVKTFMTRKVVTCTRADTVSAVMEMMTAGKFRHVPVVDNGRVVGMISIGDVVKFRVNEYEREQAAMRDYIKSA